MTPDTTTNNAFLFQLYTATGGDPDEVASSSDVGAALGLEPDEAGEIAQSLCILGLAELKTLSGGIGITVQGLNEINQKAPAGSSAALLTLSPGPVLDPEDIKAVESTLKTIKEKLTAANPSYERTEELVMDIKTIDIQMLSPQPKTQIIKAVFNSLKLVLNDMGQDELTAQLDGLINS